MAPKRAMRRPAAAPKRARVRARPAALDADDDWEKPSEVNVRELNSWPAIYIQGLYWDNNAEVIGEMISLEVGEDGTLLTVKAHGTTSEELLRLLSGKASKLLQVHLCDEPCSHLTWKEGLIHAQRLKRCHFEDHAWSRNAEVSVREAERDELAILRREAAERGKRVGVSLGAPGAAAEEAARRGRQEEEEEAEEGKGANGACQKPRVAFCDDRPRPQRGGPAQASQEGQAPGAKSPSQEEFVRLQLEQLFKWNLDGGRRPARGVVRPDIGAAAHLAPVSWRSHIDDDFRGTKGDVSSTWSRPSRSGISEPSSNGPNTAGNTSWQAWLHQWLEKHCTGPPSWTCSWRDVWPVRWM